VTTNGSATLPEDAAAVMVDHVAMYVGFSGKSNGEAHDVHVKTVKPEREFLLAFGEDSVSMSSTNKGEHVTGTARGSVRATDLRTTGPEAHARATHR